VAGETFLQKDLTTKRTKMVTSVQEGGEASANRIASLDGSGKFPISMMPSGLERKQKFYRLQKLFLLEIY